MRAADLEEPDGEDADQRDHDAGRDDRLGDAPLLVRVGRAHDGAVLRALLPQEPGLLGDRCEHLPLGDGRGLAADLVPQPVLAGESVRRDLLQQLHGAERAVVHLVLADDVARARIGLEASLEGAEPGRGIVDGLAAGRGAERSMTGAPKGSPPPKDDGTPADLGIVLTPLVSASAFARASGGSIENFTSTSSSALWSRRASLMSGG